MRFIEQVKANQQLRPLLIVNGMVVAIQIFWLGLAIANGDSLLFAMGSSSLAVVFVAAASFWQLRKVRNATPQKRRDDSAERVPARVSSRRIAIVTGSLSCFILITLFSAVGIQLDGGHFSLQFFRYMAIIVAVVTVVTFPTMLFMEKYVFRPIVEARDAMAYETEAE